MVSAGRGRNRPRRSNILLVLGPGLAEGEEQKPHSDWKGNASMAEACEINTGVICGATLGT